MKTKEEIEQLAIKDFNNRQECGHYELADLKSRDYYDDGFINGYTQCQEDMADKKYTEEDIRKAFKYGVDMEAGIEPFDYKNYPDGFSQFINSLNKQD